MARGQRGGRQEATVLNTGAGRWVCEGGDCLHNVIAVGMVENDGLKALVLM